MTRNRTFPITAALAALAAAPHLIAKLGSKIVAT
jgi:hypothetical protein